MSLSSTDQIFQLLAWFLALVEFVLALYILLLNAQHNANRHVSALLLLFAINNLGTGMLIAATDPASAYLPMILLAATSMAMQPGLLLVSVVLLKPEWMQGQWRRAWWSIYGLAALPLLLTLLDVGAGTALWFTGLDAATYNGGYVATQSFVQGILAGPLRVFNIYVMGLAPFIPILYVILIDKKASRLNRWLAVLLGAAQIVTLVLQMGLRTTLGPVLPSLLTGAVLALGYGFAGFQQMISERRAQQGRLQVRLTALLLAVALPILMAMVVFVSQQTSYVLQQKADEQLEATNRALASNVTLWLDLNTQALKQLVSLPDIVSMDPARQKPILETMAASHPHMYLVSTTNLFGVNVARNDGEAPKDYHDRLWHIGARNGAPVTYQMLVGRTSGEPALVISMPIRRETGTIVGVGMFASDLNDITLEVQATEVGENGYAYVVDGLNEVVAHPEEEYAAELHDLDYYPPVFALRAGTQGLLTFTDDQGQEWRAYTNELENGWAVVVQQPVDELLTPVRRLRILSWAAIGAGGLILLLLVGGTVRQALRPIGALTDTATAIAAGDLTRVAAVESGDEVGAMARAFNSMTAQLRELIGSLEQQVEDRTQDLKRRSAYLEATAEVSHAAASILDPGQLMRDAVEMVRERFGLYYVGLFMVDEAGKWAVLRAGTGAPGAAMLARGHRLRVGEGMIGWAVAHSQSRVALEAGEDAVRLATPELPDTRSEAALPLRSRGRILGALTVQHTEPGAFDPDTMSVLQTMADQIAVALDNARLFAESQAALDAERRAYGELSRQAWTDLLRARPDWGYRYSQRQVQPADGEWKPEMLQAERTGQLVQSNGEDKPTLAVPLKIRDEVVGVIGFSKDEPDRAWSPEETALLQSFVSQVELALDSARLYEDTQRRAARERLTGEVAARIRETLDLETVLKTAAQEIRQALGVPEVVVRLAPGQMNRDAKEGEDGHGDGR